MKFSFSKHKSNGSDHECVYWFYIDKKRIYTWNIYKYLRGPGEEYAYYVNLIPSTKQKH